VTSQITTSLSNKTNNADSNEADKYATQNIQLTKIFAPENNPNSSPITKIIEFLTVFSNRM